MEDKSPLKEKPQVREEKRALAEEQPARLEVFLVQQQHLEELQECQRWLTLLVEGYLLAVKQVVQCTDIRTLVGGSVGKPQQLARYTFWNSIRIKLDDIRSFAPDLALLERKLGAAAQAFNAALERAKAEVDKGAEEYAQSDDAQRKEIARSALQFIREMTDAVSDIAKECPDEIRNVRDQITSCIERILEQPRPDDSARASSQAAGVRPRPPQSESASKRPTAQPDRWFRSGHDPSQTRKAESVVEIESKAEERRSLPFKLQIGRLTDGIFEVRVLEAAGMGEPHETSTLPYDPVGLIAVLKLLELGYRDPDLFSEVQREVLGSLGLVRDGSAAPDLLASLGKGLYKALFPGRVGNAFQTVLQQARSRREAVALQLRFDEEAVNLARYPWELLHDGHRHLLSGGLVEMTRYITYSEAVTGLEVRPPWRLLFIAPRPGDLLKLPDDAERFAVWESLQSLNKPGRLTLERLDPPTHKELLDRIREDEYHIIHFDGHGVFARRCPQCEAMHYSHAATCERCGALLEGVEPLGYLAFEGPDGQADYVSTKDLENLVVRSEVRLAFLSACQSATVRGESIFGGLGPGLIEAGVPAVVAMQLPVTVGAAVEFARGFYKALAQAETIPRAVAEGRMGLFRSKAWYVPALYLRSADEKGRLFVE